MSSMLTMVENIHSLFYVDERHLTQFQQWSAQLAPLLQENFPQTSPISIQQAATIYNMWLLLNQQRYDIYFDEGRRFTHSAHRYFYEALKQHPLIEPRIASVKDEREVYVLAYFLGLTLGKWINELLQRRDKTHLEMILNLPTYYSLREHTLTAEQFDDLLNAQKELTILIQQDQTHENSLRQYIHEALAYTQQICVMPAFAELGAK